MTEATLKRTLVTTLRRLPGSEVIRHEERFESGVPDISVTWGGATTWLEVKLVTGYGKTSRGAQDLRCARLEAAGRCTMVLYVALDDLEETWLVSPALMLASRGKTLQFINNELATTREASFKAGQWSTGLNHQLVANWLRGNRNER